MTSNQPGGTGMGTPHPQDHPDPDAGLPAEEHIDPGTVEEDLEADPDEKRNATDGYAPADDPDQPDTLEMDEQES